jgi:hypothetical protein
LQACPDPGGSRLLVAHGRIEAHQLEEPQDGGGYQLA